MSLRSLSVFICQEVITGWAIDLEKQDRVISDSLSHRYTGNVFLFFLNHPMETVLLLKVLESF